jgi:hypothetical protein
MPGHGSLPVPPPDFDGGAGVAGALVDGVVVDGVLAAEPVVLLGAAAAPAIPAAAPPVASAPATMQALKTFRLDIRSDLLVGCAVCQPSWGSKLSRTLRQA